MKKKIFEFFKNTTVRIISILLLILFVLSIFLFFDAYVRQVKKGVSFYFVYRGDKYYKNNKTQRAIDYYKKALSYYPGHYRARYNLANIYVVYEDYYSALSEYAKALQYKPDFMIARIDYALVLSSATFNHDRAIEEYQTAIDKKPKWVYIPFFINNIHTGTAISVPGSYAQERLSGSVYTVFSFSPSRFSHDPDGKTCFPLPDCTSIPILFLQVRDILYTVAPPYPQPEVL